MITKNKKGEKKQLQVINKAKEQIIAKYFGKAPVFGNGLAFQQKLRSK